MPTRYRRATTWLTAAVLLLADASSLLAAPTPSRALGHSTAVQGLLGSVSVMSAEEQQKVEEWLAALGCPADRVKAVLVLLSPSDVHQLALNIRQLQVAGGSRTRIVLTVAAVVVVVLVILVIRSKPRINLGDSY